MLTIFSSARPFHGEFNAIQRNAIKSWLLLSPRPEIILIGREEGVGDVCKEFGLLHVSEVEHNNEGLPLVSSMFHKAKMKASGQTICYVNSDIIIMQDFIEAIEIVSKFFTRFLIICNRWDVDNISERLDFSEGWENQLKLYLKSKGIPKAHIGSDLLVFPKNFFVDMPPFATGIPVWDNWMIYKYRSQEIPVVDISERAMIVHENHSHTHHAYRGDWQAEARQKNLELAGGYGYVFTSSQATHKLTEKGLIPNFSYLRLYYDTNRIARRFIKRLSRYL